MKYQFLRCVVSCVGVLILSSCSVVKDVTTVQTQKAEITEAVESTAELEQWISDWSTEKSDSGATELRITVKGEYGVPRADKIITSVPITICKTRDKSGQIMDTIKIELTKDGENYYTPEAGEFQLLVHTYNVDCATLSGFLDSSGAVLWCSAPEGENEVLRVLAENPYNRAAGGVTCCEHYTHTFSFEIPCTDFKEILREYFDGYVE